MASLTLRYGHLAKHVTQCCVCNAGENIITIVGGANQAEWKFSDDDRKVSLAPFQAKPAWSLCESIACKDRQLMVA